MTNDGSSGLFLLPDCFWTLSVAWTQFDMSNLIIQGSASIPDPLLRLSALTTNLQLSNVRLINPNTTYAGPSRPYTPKWTTMFSHMPLLTKLKLSNCSLIGSIPSDLPSLCTLFNVSHNALTGTVPAILANASVLLSSATLDLSHNLLSGSITSALLSPIANTAAQVLAVDLSANAMTGTVPSDLLVGVSGTSALYSIQVDLSENKLTGSVPQALLWPISKATHATQAAVYLDSNQLSGTISSGLLNVSMNNGSYLSFGAANNSLTGSITPNTFSASLLNLASVDADFSMNQLSGSISATLFSNFIAYSTNMNNLALNLSRNGLSGSLPSFWSNLALATQLSNLDMDFSYNGLSGSIPTSLCPAAGVNNALTSIYWYLHSNALTGSVPSALVGTVSSTVNYFYAHLHNNSLSGSLPSMFTSGGQLNSVGITLNSNQLSGTVSSTLLSTFGSNLQYLAFDVSANGLSGTISDSFLQPFVVDASFPCALFLNLSRCGLTGTIPKYLSNNVAKAKVFLDHNQFSGTFPSVTLFPAGSSWSELELTVSAVNNTLSGTLNLPQISTPYPISINVSRNNFSNLAVDASADYLLSIDVSENTKMTGSVPSIWFGSSSKLLDLAAGHTSLSGDFPSVSGILNIPLRYLNLSFTPVAFCNGTRSPWSASNMTSCDLHQTAASQCADSYPAVCNTRFASPSGASVLAISVPLLAALALIGVFF